MGLPGGTLVKNVPANAGCARDLGSIPGSRRSLGGGPGNPFQYSCLENSMDRGAWWATVHGVTKSWTQLSTHAHVYVHTHTYIHTHTHIYNEILLLLLSHFSHVQLRVIP